MHIAVPICAIYTRTMKISSSKGAFKNDFRSRRSFDFKIARVNNAFVFENARALTAAPVMIRAVQNSRRTAASA